MGWNSDRSGQNKISRLVLKLVFVVERQGSGAKPVNQFSEATTPDPFLLIKYYVSSTEYTSRTYVICCVGKIQSTEAQAGLYQCGDSLEFVSFSFEPSCNLSWSLFSEEQTRRSNGTIIDCLRDTNICVTKDS